MEHRRLQSGFLVDKGGDMLITLTERLARLLKALRELAMFLLGG